MQTTYHPDPAINAEVAEQALEAERIDMAAGFPPSAWICPQCSASHNRGHFGNIGTHRCLSCGYVGGEGVLLNAAPWLTPPTGVTNSKLPE